MTTENSQSSDQPRIFISYSRRDKEFVHKLHDALEAQGVNAWVDWEGIPLSSDWMAEITQAIEIAEAYIFVISPDSLNSKVCAQELELGIKNNKKLIPVLFREPAADNVMPPRVGATNWVYMREQDEFNEALIGLVGAIHTDLEWNKQSARLLRRATEWEKRKRNSSFLLRGSDLAEAESWSMEAASQKGRDITQLQAQYLAESRQDGTRRQRQLLGGVSGALILTIFLAIMAAAQWRDAVEARAIAESKEHERATQQALAEYSQGTAIANELARATQQALAEYSQATAIANEQARATQQSIAVANELLARENERIAKEQTLIAEAQRLAAQAKIKQSPKQLHISTLLAIESLKINLNQLGEETLRENLALLPKAQLSFAMGGEVTSLKYTRDGSKLLVASNNGRVDIRESATGSVLVSVRHEAPVVGAQFGPDEKWFVSASSDGNISLWDSASGQEIKHLKNTGALYAFSLSPDGKWLANGGEDGVIYVWSIELGRVIQKLLQNSPINLLQFHPDGKALAASGVNGKIIIWQPLNGQSLAAMQHYGKVIALNFSPDGQMVGSAGADSMARIFFTFNGLARGLHRHGDWVEDIIFSPDGRMIATASDDGTVRIWDTIYGTELQRLRHEDYAQYLAFSPDGRLLASSSTDDTARIWDITTGLNLAIMPLDGDGSWLSFSPDGEHLTTTNVDGHVQIWKLDDIVRPEALYDQAELGGFVRTVAIRPDSKQVFSATDDFRARLFGITTSDKGQSSFSLLPGTMEHDSFIRSAVYNPQGTYVATGGSDGVLHLWNLAQRTATNFLNGSSISTIAFLPGSQYMAVGSEDGLVRLWDTKSGTVQQQWQHSSGIAALRFSHAGSLMAVGTKDGQVAIWQTTAEALQRPPGEPLLLPQKAAIVDLDFSSNLRWLAVALADNNILIYNVLQVSAAQRAIDPVLKLPLSDEISRVSFSPDSLWLVSASANRVQFWGTYNGELLASIPFKAKVTDVMFTPDGKSLLTTNSSLLVLWDVSSIHVLPRNQLIDEACDRLPRNLTQSEWSLLFGEQTAYNAICTNLANLSEPQTAQTP